MDAETTTSLQELTILTSYSESIFLLASKMSIDSIPIELFPAPGGKGYVLHCKDEWSYFQLPFEKVLTPVSELLQSYGANRVGKFWSEPSPVFEVDFDSQASIEQMTNALKSGQVHEGIRLIILSLVESTQDLQKFPEGNLKISLELLQVLPNADTKDAIIHQVNSANSSRCVRLWNKRKVFDIEALLRQYRSKPLGGLMGASGDIHLLDLVRELKEVVGWMRLGLHLGVPKHTLETIRRQYAMYGEEMVKTEMLSTWLDGHTEEPTWAEVVSAVSRIGNKRVARRIADKYGLALAVLKEAEEASSDAMATDDPLEPLRREVEETHRAVEDNESQIQLYTYKKRMLEGDIPEIQHNCEAGQRYTAMLAKDKESLEQKLEEREKEIRSLQAQQLEYERTIHDLEMKLATAGSSAKAKQKLKEKLKYMKQEKTELVECIESKEKEVRKLTTKMSKLKLKLERVKTELSDAQNQLRSKTSQLDDLQQQLQFVQDQRDKLKQQLEVQEKAMEDAVMQSIDSDKVDSKVSTQLQNWTHCKDMPFGMSRAQAVVLDGKVYIGGGYTDMDGDKHTILVYTPEVDEWSCLPSCPLRRFAMASLNHQLVCAGGQMSSPFLDLTTMLTVWNTDKNSDSWTQPYPPMLTARCYASAIGYKHFLVVIGGRGDTCGPLMTTVEILDTLNSQWHTGIQLPVTSSSMTSALLGDMLYVYLMGETSDPRMAIQQVLTISLPTLISYAISHTSSTMCPVAAAVPTWESIPETPLPSSTALALQNTLFAIARRDIHFYNPVSKTWQKFGDIPVRRVDVTCVVLPSGELFVGGGWTEYGERSNEVYKVTILFE